MKTIRIKAPLIFLILLAFISVCSLSFTSDQRSEGILKAFRSYTKKYSDEMLAALEEFKKDVSVESKWDSSHIALIKKDFIRCRASYKKVQMFTSHFFFSSERSLNGPVVMEIEDESEYNPAIEYPHGFQVMEEYLWSENPQQWKKELRFEVDLMHDGISIMNESFRTISTDETQVLDAIQLQIVRTFFLGITYFDTPKCRTALVETRNTFQAMLEVFNSSYSSEKDSADVREVRNQFNRTVNFFNKTQSLESFNYLACLRDYYIPLSKAFSVLRKKVRENSYSPSSAVNFNQKSLFEVTAFNTFFYNPRGRNLGLSYSVSELGKTLFFDPVFSENNKRACASCHKPEYAFTDNLKTGPSFHIEEKLSRNTPTILNSALQSNYFYDMRASTLEMQIGHVLTNEKEMASSFDTLVRKLNSSPEYVDYFRRVFKGTRDTVINMNSIINAIAEYERKLISFNSKFDRNVRGEERTFSKEEQNGFNIFMNKGRCASCHYLPVFNNLVPPIYKKSEFEIIGTTSTFDTLHPKLDPDQGRGGLYGTKIFMNAFKTPTLRNIALTAPYMHNGAFDKLEDVIVFYNNGGGKGMGLDVPNQTLPSDSLHLNSIERKALVSFLKTLTDTTNLNSKPARLPSYPGNSELNNRKIGGEY